MYTLCISALINAQEHIITYNFVNIISYTYNVIIDRAKFASAQDWSGTYVIVIKKQHFFILYNTHTPFLARVLNNNNARHDEYIHNIRNKTSWIGITFLPTTIYKTD